MSSLYEIPDRAAREAAETTFDRNVVVIAGAGTGKTTLLVNRLVHLVMKEPRPVPITQVVALTFTNKAALEMKVRLRERLMWLADPRTDGARAQDGGAVSAQDLQERYGITRGEIAVRARAGLADIEKAQIGTLHSFAAHLLRLHPLESGVDPDFQEDDGLRFEEHFTQAWDVWIDQELSRQGANHDQWRRLLGVTTLEEVRTLAHALSSELVDLSLLQKQLAQDSVSPNVVRWVGERADRAHALLKTYDRPKRRKIEEMLGASVSLLTRVANEGPSALQQLDVSTRDWLSKDVGSKVKDWDEAEFQEAKRLIQASQSLLDVDHGLFEDLLKLLSPLVASIRSSFVDKGWLSFDGLLARARALLHEHPRVREGIKREYRAVLVDEFQDTDPIQYEIILAVSEQLGCYETAWQDMRLDSGKLFIVGDPKQSIYAFRRADIEAFDRVVDKITQGGGVVQTLTTNFRSAAAVLDPVNDIFDRLFVHHPLVQPANVRLEVRPHRRPSTMEAGVQLLVTTPADGDEPFDADLAVRAEGEVLARWLKDEILSRPNIVAGQVALLFRKLTQADAYLDALRRHNISYVIEGEKHFYRRQEVIDLVNVLRVLDHPHDRIALTGLLRSPLGGLTDRELFEFHDASQLEYRLWTKLDSFDHPRAAAIRRLYEQLSWLHQAVPAVPLADAIQVIFDRLPLLESAAASLHGEQAVANLLKVKQTAAALSDRATMTLSAFIELMVERLEEQPEEAESPLAEESSNAVQILTIHKAKGLEFPIVVLPGLHQGTGRDRTVPHVAHDWSSGIYGLSLGSKRTIGAVLAQAKFAVREEAERRRVFYVGMTRAKELLVLSGGKVARSVGETTFEWLQQIGTGQVGEVATQELSIGASTIPHRVVHAPERTWQRQSFTTENPAISIDVSSIARLWEQRKERWSAVGETEWHLTPTSMVQCEGRPRAPSRSKRQLREVGRLTGIAAHRLLERWSFSSPPSGLVEQIGPVLQEVLQSEEQSLLPTITDSLRELFTAFGKSKLYGRLQSAQILGREVPFIMPWGDRQVMEGVIDLLYRFDGELWIADYKTDLVSADQAAERAEQYRPQGRVYMSAVEQALGVKPRFHCLFLRCGAAVEL
ncbi:MAG: UvrD-helicase domain-containing protein [Nitrospira sp.]|nr:UvrD-helicase domain-containing protein [Nitrospira sp.]MDH4303755.1 UvrD-helicase domain-containing protein [Nitrospira sp.]MDH5193703.1 UvrD-helicase domain-containing protein [Nitrospira sp.]